jgi:protein-disulfide isomerase
LNLKTIITVVGVFLVAVLLLGMMVLKSGGSGPAPLKEEDRARLVRMHSPTLGKPDAPVTIVEFFDPACGTCRDFYPFVKQMMSANPDRIKLVVRFTPFHKNSDQVVAMLEAARKQGKFWPALEAVLQAQDDWVLNHVSQPDRVWRHLEGLGLNLDKLRADAASPEVGAVIKQDMQDALALQVSKTPEFFVNGRPMPKFGYEELQKLVSDALASTR